MVIRLTKKHFYILGLLIALILGSFLTTFIQAHGGNNNLVHACVGTGVLNQGRLRVIDANGSCNSNETPLDWVKQVGGTELPFFCTGCTLPGGAPGNTHPLLQGSDYSNGIFWSTNFIGNNLSGKNFSNAKMASSLIQFADLTGTNFTGADLRLAEIGSSDATEANFTNANLEDATGLDDVTILTDAIWDNTICPDGTNSDSHGNTCEGHLTP